MPRGFLRFFVSFPARKAKVAFAILLAGFMVLVAPSARANDDLHFFKNYFVTGDYAVAGVGLWGLGNNGFATGTVNMGGVPQGADIVAAFLYWETVETATLPASGNGFFDGQAIVGAVLGNPQTPPCWSSGGTAGQGLALRVYRADVLRYLAVDTVHSVRVANGVHTVKLADSGGGGNGQPPHTEGASLVVIYRLLSPGAAPLKAVVMYDGATTMTKSSPAFSQTMGGFYQASGGNGTAKMTQLVGNGQPGFAETLTVTTPSGGNGNIAVGVSGTPFMGAQGTRWDNLTFNVNLNPNDSSLTTQVTAGGNQVCLSWGAVLTSTNVVNSDLDGLLDKWKTNGLHLNVGDSTHPATFGGCTDFPNEPCENLPAMGAVLGTAANPHKDIFVEMDWMHGSDANSSSGHLHVPKLAALDAVATAFARHNIYLHFDVGNNYQDAGKSYIVPVTYAQGGEVIEESSLLCPNSKTSVCAFSEPYSVMSWKKGFEAIKNGFPLLSIPAHFAHDRKDIFHYVLFGHALATPFDAAGKPLTKDPASVSGVADRPGGDLLVTLGLWPADDPAGCDPKIDCADETGTALVQAGTLMHELGHNLGLSHAGLYKVPNCMANYPSVMNYMYQTRGLTDAAGIEHIDYSSGLLLPLNENSLSEGTPIGPLPYRIRYFGPANDVERALGTTVKAHCDGTPLSGDSAVRLETPGDPSLTTTFDWNNNGVVDAGAISQDINFNGFTGDPVKDAVDPRKALSDPTRWFVDTNDWINLNLQQIGARLNVAGLSTDVGRNDIGQSDIGQSDIGQSDIGQSDIGQSDIGQSDIGQSALGQSDIGEIDYDTVVSSLDATNASHPLASTIKIDRITLNWGAPGIGRIRIYNIYRLNMDLPQPTRYAVGSIIPPLPLATSFDDVVNDNDPTHFGPACPSTATCYNTNYAYFITAGDGVSTTSNPSNNASGIVKHLFVTTNNKIAVYGNPIPAFDATITGLDLAALPTPSCTNTTGSVPPRNVRSYTIHCTVPAAVGTGGVDGVTYLGDGTLTITVRPMTITAQPNTKAFDGTTSAATKPVVVGLAYNDTVTPLVETYNDSKIGTGKTLTISPFTVNDGNSGHNYTVTTFTNTNGVITHK